MQYSRRREKFLQNSKFLEILKQQAELKVLVEGTILVDTINLAPEMGKVTPKDTEILHKLLNLEHQPRDTNSLYKLLNEAKFDCSSLTISELLIKDYKDWELGNTKYGISSITAPVSRLADPSVEKILSKFCEENKLVFLICMTAHSTTGSFAREMVVYLGNSSEKKPLVNLLQAEKEILDLVPIQEGNTKENLFYFVQKNIKSSRKQVQPLVHKLLSKL